MASLSSALEQATPVVVTITGHGHGIESGLRRVEFAVAAVTDAVSVHARSSTP